MTEHPDYYTLHQVMLDMDGPAVPEDQKDAHYEGVLTGAVDEKTIIRLARQRVSSAIVNGDVNSADDLQALIMALWTDGFVVGVRFQQAGGHQ